MMMKLLVIVPWFTPVTTTVVADKVNIFPSLEILILLYIQDLDNYLYYMK